MINIPAHQKLQQNRKVTVAHYFNINISHPNKSLYVQTLTACVITECEEEVEICFAWFPAPLLPQ